MLILGCKNYFVKPSLWPLHPLDFLSYSCVILQILDIFFEPYVVLDKSGSYSPEIWRHAISVSSVYFSIALNSIIMRRRWLHYQRCVIGPFHQLLATHCANHRSASLTINRCDLVIKQGDGENMLVLLFLYIYVEQAIPLVKWAELQICAGCRSSGS